MPKLIERTPKKKNVKNMMLMLKKLVLKMVKKYINIYNYKLSLLGRDDTKQAKTVIFNVVPPSRTISKSTKKKKKKSC